MASASRNQFGCSVSQRSSSLASCDLSLSLRLCQRPAAQGQLLHQPIFGKQLCLLGRGKALLAQLFPLVKQDLQAGEGDLGGHRQAALGGDKGAIARLQHIGGLLLGSVWLAQGVLAGLSG